nr:PDZ domain-containing protein [Burkholderiaceae bacterium]
GIRPGDVIVKIANQPVTDVAQLLTTVAALKPGTPVHFGVERKNQVLDLEVSPGVRPKPRLTPR